MVALLSFLPTPAPQAPLRLGRALWARASAVPPNCAGQALTLSLVTLV